MRSDRRVRVPGVLEGIARQAAATPGIAPAGVLMTAADCIAAFLVAWIVWELFSGYGETQIALFAAGRIDEETEGERSIRRLYDTREVRDRYYQRERSRRKRSTVRFLVVYSLVVIAIAVLFLHRLGKI
jgi:hypothetical protein